MVRPHITIDENGNYKHYYWEQWCEDNLFLYPVLPDCQGLPFEIARIYPLKQREVRDVYNYLSKNKFVKGVWVFGSSANMKCTIDSDLDLAIETVDSCTPEERGKISVALPSTCKNGCDIIWWDTVKYGSKLYGQIRKGVRLF